MEMILETVKPRKNNVVNTQEKRAKCTNCGAIISETSVRCPECGYVLQKENIASSDAREWIANLQKALLDAASSSSNSKRSALDSFLQKEEVARLHKQLNIINTFTMPVTKEGLTQMLEFSYSNYISANSSSWDGEQIKQAWYGRCVQAYNALQRIATDDNGVETFLAQYSDRLKKANKRLSNKTKVLLGCLIALFVCGIIIYYGAKGEGESHEIVEQYLQEGNYQGARNAAKTYSDRNLVSTAEVLYLISIGEFNQAKVVASTIEDKEKRKEMQQAISEAEKQY